MPRPEVPASPFFAELAQRGLIEHGKAGAFLTDKAEPIALEAFKIAPDERALVILRFRRPTSSGETRDITDQISNWFESSGLDENQIRFMVIDSHLEVATVLKAVAGDSE